MMDANRKPLPTRAQINAITDIKVLAHLRDDVDAVITKITTDLQWRDDPEWRPRACSALALHRTAARLIGRRLAALNADRVVEPNTRPDAECDPLTVETLAQRPNVDPQSLTTVAELDEFAARLAACIDAVQADREDEIALAASERDEGFLAATGSALRNMRGLRQVLQNRRGELSRAERKAQIAIRHADNSRERLFVNASREILDRDTFMAIWDRVDRMQAQQVAA